MKEEGCHMIGTYTMHTAHTQSIPLMNKELEQIPACQHKYCLCPSKPEEVPWLIAIKVAHWTYPRI